MSKSLSTARTILPGIAPDHCVMRTRGVVWDMWYLWADTFLSLVPWDSSEPSPGSAFQITSLASLFLSDYAPPQDQEESNLGSTVISLVCFFVIFFFINGI